MTTNNKRNAGKVCCVEPLLLGMGDLILYQNYTQKQNPLVSIDVGVKMQWITFWVLNNLLPLSSHM